MMVSSVNKIGYWSAVLSLIFAIGYGIPKLLSTFKIIPHPQDLFWLFLPSLFLAPAFLVAIICLHFIAVQHMKIWTSIGWTFAATYCVMATIVYFVQLTVVLPHELKGELDPNYVLLFEPKTFLTAVDCLGYFFMSLSTLFTAFAFKNEKQKCYIGDCFG